MSDPEGVRSYRIVALPGDGIGPEVTREALDAVALVADAAGFSVSVEEAPIGGASIDATGVPLHEDVVALCLEADAVLLGAVGGPAWDDLPPELRPEQGLLGLRRALGVYANLRPARVSEALAGLSPLRRERVLGTDLLVVRELTGGIYFGRPASWDGDEALNTMRYRSDEVARIARIAFAQARRRRGRVTSVDKANVLAVSRLWRHVVSELHLEEYADVELNHMYVDNAAMQLVLDPGQFDVILTGNLFGDILSDVSATLVGSLGTLPSASLGGRVGLFEPVHGSAPDLAGTGRANPVAAVLSAAMMLDDLGETVGADTLRAGVTEALASGARTSDLAGAGERAQSTSEMGALIRDRSLRNLPRPAPAARA